MKWVSKPILSGSLGLYEVDPAADILKFLNILLCVSNHQKINAIVLYFNLQFSCMIVILCAIYR